MAAYNHGCTAWHDPVISHWPCTVCERVHTVLWSICIWNQTEQVEVIWFRESLWVDTCVCACVCVIRLPLGLIRLVMYFCWNYRLMKYFPDTSVRCTCAWVSIFLNFEMPVTCVTGGKQVKSTSDWTEVAKGNSTSVWWESQRKSFGEFQQLPVVLFFRSWGRASSEWRLAGHMMWAGALCAVRWPMRCMRTWVINQVTQMAFKYARVDLCIRQFCLCSTKMYLELSECSQMEIICTKHLWISLLSHSCSIPATSPTQMVASQVEVRAKVMFGPVTLCRRSSVPTQEALVQHLNLEEGEKLLLIRPPTRTLVPFRLSSILYMIAPSHSSTCLLSRRGPAVLRRSADICSACQVRRNRAFPQGAHTVQSETHPTDVIHNSPADKSSSGGELLSSAHSAHNPSDCRGVSCIRDPKTYQLPNDQGNNILSPLCRYHVLKLTYWQMKTRKTQMWTHIHVHSLPTFTHTYRGWPLYRHCKQMCMCSAKVLPSYQHQKENSH